MNEICKNTLGLALVCAAALVLAMAAPAVASDGKAVFEETCQLCHGDGIAGAPKFGSKEAWGSRLGQGLATLEKHAIDGYEGENVMPAKGGNPDLSDDDVKAAVKYMVDAVK